MTAMQYTMKDSGVPWIGEIPEHWNTTQLKRVLVAIKDGTHGTFERVAEGKMLLSAKNVFDDGIHIGNAESYISENDFTTIVANGFPKRNDLVLCIVGTVGRVCIYDYDYPLAFQRSVAFLRCKTDIIPSYLKYLLQSPSTAEEEYLSCNGTAQVGLYLGEVAKLSTLLPPLVEQEAIAAYLDEKCGAIDGIIAEAKATIEEYKAWKASVIFEAVTKGLDPNAEMKDSGIEWIGSVPKNVEVIKLKYLIREYKAGPFGSALITSALLPEGNILVYTPEHIAQKTTQNEKNLYLPEDRREEMEQFFVELGDIIFPIVGSLGRAMRISQDMPCGIINQRLAKFKIDETRINAAYFMWIFANSNFYSPYIDLFQRGSIIVNLTKSIVCDMPVILPNLTEQKRIVEHLDRQCSAIDAIIAEKQTLIDDLEAYKKSLIFEAVTGKRRVC